MEAKIKVEPNEVFFYLDKLIRKIKIVNLNEYPVKFELLTVLNDQDLSPLQANETQAVIEPTQSFTVSLEYKDSLDKNCDSIIILAIYKVIDDDLSIDPEPIQEPIHVPFHFRKVHLVSSAKDRKEATGTKETDKKKEGTKGEVKDETKDGAKDGTGDVSDDEKATSSDSDTARQASPGKLKRKNLFKKPNRFRNILGSSKPKGKQPDADKLGDSQRETRRDDAEPKAEVNLNEKSDAEKASDTKEDSIIGQLKASADSSIGQPKESVKEDSSAGESKVDSFTGQLKESMKDLKLEVKKGLDQAKQNLKQAGNRINKQIRGEARRGSRQESNEDTNYQDDLSLYDHNQINSLRYEEDNVRKLAKLIFLITFLNLCYTVFLAFFNPLNQLWLELIDSYSLTPISERCSTWPELGQLFKNMTCFKRGDK